MAALGSNSKSVVFDICSKFFKDSFMYNGGKELRINLMENGVPVQLKMTLTAAKSPVSPDSGEIIEVSADTKASVNCDEPTEEEMEKVSEYLKMLGLI